MPDNTLLHDQENRPPRPKLILVICALSIALLISFIDQSSLGVALPTIGADLNSATTISWAGTSNLIANTTFQVLYGRLSDIFGRKVVFLSAVCLLAAADLACGFASSGPMLYALRGLSGVGSAGVVALTMMIVSDLVTLRERGKYQGILGSCVGLGNTLGPFLAAVFVEKASWRALFWFISPLVLLSGAITLFVVPSKRPNDSMMSKVRKVDYLGSFFNTAGIILLLIPISGGGTYFAWKSPTVIVMLNLGGICMFLFLVTEWKVARLPIMPLRLFRSPAVSAILAQNFLYGIVYYSILYYLPIYFQAVRRFTPLASAGLQITVVLGQSLASIASGQYISRCGRYGELLWLGYGLWTLGAALTCLFSRTIPVPAIATILFIEGIGVGNCFQSTFIAFQVHCLKVDRAVIISTRNFCRTLGGATGLAISASLFSNVLQSHVSHSHPSLPYSYLKTVTSSIFIVLDLQNLSNAQRNDVLDAYMAASRALFIMWVPIMATCWASCVFVKDRGLTRPDEMDEIALVAVDVEGGKSSTQELHGLDDATPAYEMEEGARSNGNKSSNETEDKKAPVADSKQIEKNKGSRG